MLIIVESPAKAKTISRIVGSKYIVKASVGHIRRITDDKKNNDGKPLEINGIDIENNFEPIFEVDEKKKTVVSDIKKLAKNADKIYFATDFDREGEAISWHLAKVLGVKDLSKVERLEFHEITAKAINEALANPKPLRMGMVTAQKGRQVLDKLVGYKVSPFLWKMMSKNTLSAGRVQSPALKLIVDREREINAFIPEEFWNVRGFFNSDIRTFSKESNTANPDLKEKDVTLIEEDNGDTSLYLSLTEFEGKKVEQLTNKQDVEKVLGNLDKIQDYKVSALNTKKLTVNPKAPFITSTLQQGASTSLGFNPKRTMGVAQKLYEGVDISGTPTALITYMRTDSYNLSQDAITAIRKWIQANEPEVLPKEPNFYAKKAKNAQEAHEAIRPVDITIHPDSLLGKIDDDMQKLYNLIWKQTVACQMTPEIKEILQIKLTNTDKYEFTGSLSWTKDKGYKVLFPNMITYKPKNINLELGDVSFLNKIETFQKFTQPPSRFSQASLIKELEKLGIGRPSTYASIITTLYDREYVVNNTVSKSTLQPTNLGIKIIEILEKFLPDLTSSVFTAQMEDKLDEIANCTGGVEEMDKMYVQSIQHFWDPLKAKVEEQMGAAILNRDEFKTSQSDEKCPTCGSEMVLKLGRFGDYLQCQAVVEHRFKPNYREVESALKLAQESFNDQAIGHKCEDCSKDLIVRVSNSTLNPYIACPDYRVGTKHSIIGVNFGKCPKCKDEGRDGVLVKRKAFRGTNFIGCSLDKDTCGYIQPKVKEVEEIITQ
jgi:DNA topoisomerase I